MYRIIENNLDSILESMFEVNDDDLSVTIESFNSFIDDTVGMSYASEGKMAELIGNANKLLANAADAVIKFFQELYNGTKKFTQGLAVKHSALQKKIMASMKKAGEKLEKDTNIIGAMKLAYTYDKEFNDKAVQEFVKICNDEIDKVESSSSEYNRILAGIFAQNVKLSDAAPDTQAEIEGSIKAINDAVKDLSKKKKDYRGKIKEAIASKYPNVKPSQIGAMLTITTGALKDINDIKEFLDLIANNIKENEAFAKEIKRMIKNNAYAEGSKNDRYTNKNDDDDVIPGVEDAKAAVNQWKKVSKYYSKFVKVSLHACNVAVRGFTTSEFTTDGDGVARTTSDK